MSFIDCFREHSAHRFLPVKGDQSGLTGFCIFARGLAQFFGCGGDIQKIIGQLKRKSHCFAVSNQRGALLLGWSRDDGSRLTGKANVLVYANTDAAGAVRNILKSAAKSLEVGPILMGMGNRAHIVTPAITARGLLNIAALAGADVSSYG